MTTTSKSTPKLGLAIVEGMADYNSDDYLAIEGAMLATAERLSKKWADKQLWNALFKQLPKKKKLLADLKNAANTFHCDPADRTLGKKLRETLREYEQFSTQAIQKAVKEYLATLSEELCRADKNFRKIQRRLAKQQSLKAEVKAGKLKKGSQPCPAPEEEISLALVSPEEKELQAALAKLDELPLNRIPQAAPLPKGSRFPTFATNPLFTDREKELKQLADWLKNGKKPVIIGQAASVDGSGGIGKTQLVTEFAGRYGQFFSAGVFRINFADPLLIPFEVAACTELVDGSPVNNRVQRVQLEWQNETPRLLIFENCEDPGLLTRWMPSQGGSRVIITSRQGNWDPASGVEVLLLEPLERSKSITLLREHNKNLSKSDPALDQIAADLKDLPLAVHIAGSLLRNSNLRIKPADILNTLHQPKLLKQRWFDSGEISANDYDQGVARILKVCLNLSSRDTESDQLAVDLLRWISHLAPGEAIPIALLRKVAGERINHPRVFEGGLYRLLGLGLVSENKSCLLWMHELVADFVRRLLPGNGSLAEVEQTILSAAMQANHERNSDEMQPLLAHLKYITDKALAEKADELAARLSNELGYYLDRVADFQGAKMYYEKALKVNQMTLGEANPHTAICMNNLGHLHEETGDYATSHWYYEQALEIRRKLLGEEHPDTARSLNNLGYLSQVMGNFEGARSYYEQALSIRKKVLGEDHPDTATTLNNLGCLALAMGDKANARQYYKQALSIRKDVLGKKHPDTATSLNDLGYLLQISGEYKSAKLQIEQALEIRREALGNEHPDTARSLYNLGELKQAKGDYAGARACHEEALSIRKKVLGDEHPDTAASLMSLASLSQLSGEYEKARQYYEQSLAVRKKVLGEVHPEVASTHEGLGIVLQAGGDNAGARLHYEEAQAIRSKLFIKSHPVKRTSLTQNGRRLVTALFIFAFAVFGLGLLIPGQTPITLSWHLANAGEINLLQPLSIFARDTATPTPTASSTVTLTPTPTASATNTRIVPTLYFRPTSTSKPVVIYPTSTATAPIIYYTPTYTAGPTNIPPTKIPTATENPTPRISIDTPTPVPPTDIPTPISPPDTPNRPTPRETGGPAGP
jgi:tetratricopeptide (TPR) repeat protein